MSRRISQFSVPCLKALGVSSLALGALLSGVVFSTPAAAVNSDKGQIASNSSPSLIRTAAATYPGIGALARYQFTIRVPEASKPLQAVTITQRENLEQIRFNLSRSHAFAGNRFAGGPAVSLASIRGSEPSNSNKVTVVFDPPVQPGSTVTVSLEGRRPAWGGVYLFEVTAFPVGENSPGLFLGSGQFTFP